MLKEQLLKEAQTIDASVELDSVFESVELSPEVKANFSTVFEAAVKSSAVKLAESHIAKIADLAEEKVLEESEKARDAAELELTESASKYLDHIAEQWMVENQLSVDKGIKSDLFESMLGGLKELFVEHNVVVPEESVDVVAEMEEELSEATIETAKLLEEKTRLNKEINDMKRSNVIAESTKELTESQKEKVLSLTEGMDYSDNFSTKLESIVEMIKSSKTPTVENKELNENSNINTIDKDAEGLNFVTEEVEENKSPKQNTIMDKYVAAAARLN